MNDQRRGGFTAGQPTPNADAPENTETRRGSRVTAHIRPRLRQSPINSDSTNLRPESGHQAYMIELTLDGAYVQSRARRFRQPSPRQPSRLQSRAAQTSLMAIYVVNPNTYSQANFSADAAAQNCDRYGIQVV